MQTEEVIDQIFEMNYEELMQALKALTYRWSELYPNKKILVLAVPRNDPHQQKELIEYAIRMVDREEEEKAARKATKRTAKLLKIKRKIYDFFKKYA